MTCSRTPTGHAARLTPRPDSRVGEGRGVLKKLTKNDNPCMQVHRTAGPPVPCPSEVGAPATARALAENDSWVVARLDSDCIGEQDTHTGTSQRRNEARDRRRP